MVDAIADQFKDFYTDHLPFFVVLTGLKDGDLSTLRIEVGEPARDKFFEYIEQIAKVSVSFVNSNVGSELFSEEWKWISRGEECDMGRSSNR